MPGFVLGVSCRQCVGPGDLDDSIGSIWIPRPGSSTFSLYLDDALRLLSVDSSLIREGIVA